MAKEDKKKFEPIAEDAKVLSEQSENAPNALLEIDLQSLQELTKAEQELHQRVINLHYAKVNQATEEALLNDETAKMMKQRQEMNLMLSKRYGEIKTLDLQSGEYTL